MKYNTCPKCKTKITADLAECPECGSHFSDSMQEHSTPREKSRVAMLPTVIAGVLIVIAFAGGLLFNASRHPTSETPISTPEIIETIAPTPSPTPTVTSIRLYAFGRELNADGFTAYVGDKAFALTVEVEPELRNPAVSWSITDSHDSSESAALVISPDGMSCEFTALKPTGKNELTVRCFGAEIVIPVYLWER